MIKFRCPHCGQKLGVADNYAGRRVRCSKCNQPLSVPEPQVAECPAAVPANATGMQTDPANCGTSGIPADISAHLDKPKKPDVPPAQNFSITVDEDPREAAIRLARQQRAKTAPSRAKTPSVKTASAVRSEKTARIPLSDCVPEALRLPLGLLLAILCMGAAVAAWVIAARAMFSPLCFVALLVPLAGAFGLKLVTVNPTFLIGVLGTLIGGFGIAAGKAAIAKYVVIPYQRNYADAEVLTDLPKLLADERYQLDPGQSAKFVATDSDFMMCIALFSLVDEGKADPVIARKWAFDILRSSNKTNIYAQLAAALGSGPAVPPRPEIGENDRPMFDLAWERLNEWEENETRLEHARKYFAALNRIAGQCETDRLLSKPDTAFKFALLATLGLFDALWILLGMGLAYITLTLD